MCGHLLLLSSQVLPPRCLPHQTTYSDRVVCKPGSRPSCVSRLLVQCHLQNGELMAVTPLIVPRVSKRALGSTSSLLELNRSQEVSKGSADGTQRCSSPRGVKAKRPSKELEIQTKRCKKLHHTSTHHHHTNTSGSME